jgi:two-component system, chemotaxis family, protein-glutamate methylesterase/glutaminase
MRAIKVLVVDDSAVARQAITAALSGHAGINVLAAVADPLLARARMQIEWPDVIVLDIEMPRMNGITFLRQIMSERPTPVVMCSSLAGTSAAATMQALAAGAVSVIAKPRLGVRSYLADASGDLVQAVRAAAAARVHKLAAAHPAAAPPRAAFGAEPGWLGGAADRIVTIGTSTGGPQALEALLTALPAAAPGIVVVQHMPEQFTGAFAQRLDSICRVTVREAADGDRVLPGQVLIAPGGRHVSVRRNGALYQVQVRDGPLVHHHRPSVDVLFRSVAKAAGGHALGIIMTGMGSDGAVGLKAMHDAGARTLAQDETSSIVFGMPKEAIKLGAVDRVLPLHDIAGEILRLA